ncbi:MAG TPA: methyltransferase domain-containing protein [Thermoanaerobaculia bacterium]|nr:methyltransferase domain-containing protein [Thermoanaerobaculia bacterium]
MKANPNWWETFFTGLIVDFWRRVMPPEATLAEADFFENLLDVRPGARLLDVPCGDGRLALEFARRGYRVTGVDISPDFLSAARESAASRGLAAEWRQSDMRDLPWREEFDGAFCGGSSFGYLGDEGDRGFLQAVARALKPGARFVIDAVKAAEALLPHFRDRYEMEVGDIRFAARNRYVLKTGCIENRYTLTRGGQKEVRLARHRCYTCREVVSMLEDAGFSRIKLLGSLSGEPFRLGSSRLIVFAARSG